MTTSHDQDHTARPTTIRHPRTAPTPPPVTARVTTLSRISTTLSVTGAQDVNVTTRPDGLGAGFLSTGHVTVTMAGVIVYCHSHYVLAQIGLAWDKARNGYLSLPLNASQHVVNAHRGRTKVAALTTTAITLTGQTPTSTRILAGHSHHDGEPAIIVVTGPLAVIVRDQTALTALSRAWDTARYRANEVWPR